MKVLRVSGTSEAKAVAGAVAAIVRCGGMVELHAIGSSAVYQAVKAAAVARLYLLQDDLELEIVPTFQAISSNERKERRRCICLAIQLRNRMYH